MSTSPSCPDDDGFAVWAQFLDYLRTRVEYLETKWKALDNDSEVQQIYGERLKEAKLILKKANDHDSCRPI